MAMAARGNVMSPSSAHHQPRMALAIRHVVEIAEYFGAAKSRANGMKSIGRL